MRRFTVLAALTVAAIVAASAWLVIDARSDPEPLPTAEHLPRDDDEPQQQAQAESQPDEPEDETETEPSADDQDQGQSSASQSQAAESQAAESQATESQDAADDAESDEEPSVDASASEQPDASDQQEETEEEEQPATVSDDDLPVRRLIDALDIERRPHVQAPSAARQHVVEEGESLVGIANAYGVDVHRLADDNGFALEGILPAGEVLLVPSNFTYSAEQMPPEPDPYEAGGLVWGTVTDSDQEVVHSLVVKFIDPRAGLPGAPDLVIGCISNRLVVELAWQPDGQSGGQPDGQPEELSDQPSDVRVFWRINSGPLQTSRWRVADGVLSAPDPDAWIDSLHGALELSLYPSAPDSPYRFYWYPSAGKMVETPVQANLDHCGR